MTFAIRSAVFMAALSLAHPVLAQGLKYDGPKQGAPRFVETTDAGVGGPAFKDSITGLTWMRCAVGQEFNADEKKCLGQFDALTHQQAVAFAAKVGRGWRLPTWQELESLSKDLPGGGLHNAHSSRSIITSGKSATDSNGGYNGCRPGMGFWSGSFVNGNSTRAYALLCKFRTMNQPMEVEPVAAGSGNRLAMILVRK